MEDMKKVNARNTAWKTVAFMSWGGILDACKNYGIPTCNKRGGDRKRGELERQLRDAIASKSNGKPVGMYRIVFYRSDCKRTNRRTAFSYYEAEDIAKAFLGDQLADVYSRCVCKHIATGTEAFCWEKNSGWSQDKNMQNAPQNVSDGTTTPAKETSVSEPVSRSVGNEYRVCYYNGDRVIRDRYFPKPEAAIAYAVTWDCPWYCDCVEVIRNGQLQRVLSLSRILTAPVAPEAEETAVKTTSMEVEKRLIDANEVIAKQIAAGLSDASGNYYGYADVVMVDDITNAPTVDAVEVVHGWWNPSRKHMWKMDDGEIDMYAYDQGFHNGPVCLCCGAHYCENCEPDWANTECYDNEHFECSVCGYQSMTATNYCPNCGAKMDGESNA